MHLQYFNDLWIKHQPDQNDMLEFWNRRAVSFNQHKNDTEASTRRQQLLDQILGQAKVDANSHVLDLGCGTGHYSIMMARHAADVLALDIAPKMLEFAKNNADEVSCKNVCFELANWQHVDIKSKGWEKKFQLVLASKTPAVNNLETLEKMNAASCGSCCLITQVDTANSVRDQLKPLVDWSEEKSRISRTFYCAFNLLWLMGYYPEVSYINRSWDGEISLSDAIMIYTRYFESITRLNDKQQEAIKEKMTGLAVHGNIYEQVQSKIAVMFWNV